MDVFEELVAEVLLCIQVEMVVPLTQVILYGLMEPSACVLRSTP